MAIDDSFNEKSYSLSPPHWLLLELANILIVKSCSLSLVSGGIIIGFSPLHFQQGFSILLGYSVISF